MDDCWHDDGPGLASPTDCCCPCRGCEYYNTFSPHLAEEDKTG